MAKANDKKTVKQARDLLILTVGNLCQSHRERKFRKPGGGGQPLKRKAFAQQVGMAEATIAHIETGRLLGLAFPQFRQYLAATYGKPSPNFATSARKVYDGLKEIEALLRLL